MHSRRVSAVAISGSVAATTDNLDEVRLWDLDTGDLLAAADDLSSVGDGAAFTHDGRALVVSDGHPDVLAVPRLGRVEADPWWTDLAPDTVLRRPTLDGEDTLTVAAALGGDVLVGVNGAGTMCGWDAAGEMGRVLFTGPRPPQEPLWSAAYAPLQMRLCDHGRLVLLLQRDTVVAVDAREGTAVATVPLPVRRPTAIAGHPTRPVVAVAADDGAVLWWDARTGGLLGRVRAHAKRIRGLAVSAGPGLLLTASKDGSAALWRLDTGALVDRCELAPSGRPAVPMGLVDPYELVIVAGCADGRRWLVGGRSGQVHVLAWSPDDDRLVPVRIGRPADTDDLDLEDLVDALRGVRDRRLSVARSLQGRYFDLSSTVYWRPPGADTSVGWALHDALDDAIAARDGEVAQAVLTAMHRTHTRYDSDGADHDLAAWLIECRTGEPVRSLDDLLQRYPDADPDVKRFIQRVLVLNRPTAARAFARILDETPAEWEMPIDGTLVADYTLLDLINLIYPDTADRRIALARLSNSRVPHARLTAMNYFHQGHRDARQGTVGSTYTGKWLARAMRSCALRELAAEPDPSGGYGAAGNRLEALRVLEFCPAPGDGPLVTRLLTTERDDAVLNNCLQLVWDVFDDDPHFDGGLQSALRRIAADPDLPTCVRAQAVRATAWSAYPDVEAWLVDTLDDSSPTIGVYAAMTLLERDRDRFAARIAPLAAAWNEAGVESSMLFLVERALASDD